MGYILYFCWVLQEFWASMHWRSSYCNPAVSICRPIELPRLMISWVLSNLALKSWSSIRLRQRDRADGGGANLHSVWNEPIIYLHLPTYRTHFRFLEKVTVVRSCSPPPLVCAEESCETPGHPTWSAFRKSYDWLVGKTNTHKQGRLLLPIAGPGLVWIQRIPRHPFRQSCSPCQAPGRFHLHLRTWISRQIADPKFWLQLWRPGCSPLSRLAFAS